MALKYLPQWFLFKGSFCHGSINLVLVEKVTVGASSTYTVIYFQLLKLLSAALWFKNRNGFLNQDTGVVLCIVALNHIYFVLKDIPKYQHRYLLLTRAQLFIFNNHLLWICRVEDIFRSLLWQNPPGFARFYSSGLNKRAAVVLVTR